MEVRFNIDWSKVKVNEDKSVIVGSDDVTPMQKLLGCNRPVTINGDFLLKLLTMNKITLYK